MFLSLLDYGKRWKPLENAGKSGVFPENPGKPRKTLGKISDYPLIK
jgi:hypothetical protein